MKLIPAALALLAAPALAQTLTPEELRAQIDARLAAQNPYQELLNDPDPQRSLAAMEVMLDAGDPVLTKMAVEFGMLSPNPEVQRTALHGIMSTGPVLTLRLDGTGIEDPHFKGSILQWLKGSVSDEGVGHATVAFGDWSPDLSCYVLASDGACGLTVNAEGNFLRIGGTATVQLTLGDDGLLTGSGFLHKVETSVPMSIRLLD